MVVVVVRCCLLRWLFWFGLKLFGLRIELIWKFFGDGRWSGGPTLGWEQDWLKEWGERRTHTASPMNWSLRDCHAGINTAPFTNASSSWIKAVNYWK